MRSISPEWVANREKMLVKLEEIKQEVLSMPVVGRSLAVPSRQSILDYVASRKYLHLGCGPQIIPGFINADKYVEHPDIQNFDMYNPPYEADSINMIYSSHALEHLPFRLAILAIKNWGKILKPGGELYLAIPDLEEIMLIMLDPKVSKHVKWNWYVYTLFGYQVDPDKYSNTMELDLPIEPGQFHTCGFTKEIIEHFLVDAGFTIGEMYNYDGWSTPSIWIEAVK